MSETLVIALVSGVTALLVSLSASVLALWKWQTAEKNKILSETDKLKNEGAKALSEGAAALVESQQQQYDADVKELRQTVEDLRSTLEGLRVDYRELVSEHKDLKWKAETNNKIRDQKEAILLRQIQELKAAFEDWRDWANRLREQVESAGLVPVPFKTRNTGGDVIIEPP